MKTKTIGETLREERQHHRLKLKELSNRTRIKLEYLRALEENSFNKLPAATFVKGYIKSYAQVFGFDYQPLIALLRRDYKESAKGKLVPREFVKPILKKRHLWTPVTLIVTLLGTAFAIIMVYIGLQWYQLTKPPSLEVTDPAEEAFVASQIKVVGQTAPEAIVTVNSQPVSLQPDGSFQTEIFLPREGVNTLTIEATDRRGKSTIIQRSVRVRF